MQHVICNLSITKHQNTRINKPFKINVNCYKHIKYTRNIYLFNNQHSADIIIILDDSQVESAATAPAIQHDSYYGIIG